MLKKLPGIFLILLFCNNSLYAKPPGLNTWQKSLHLLDALGCRACHDFGNRGSNLGPSLDRIGLELNEEEIFKRLQQSAAESTPGAKFMPSYQTTPLTQLKLLSRFLAQRK